MSGALDRELRKGLAKAVRAARRIAEAGAEDALGALRVDAREPDPSMSAEERLLRRWLRAHGRALGDQRHGDRQEITRLTHEVAYEHWHRMLFARFLAENDLLIEPESELAVSLDECRELARERGEDPWAMASAFAERMLPEIFRRDDPALAVPLAPETQQALEKTLSNLPAAVFRAHDALGWTYQFWQADRKEEVNRSGAKIGADELPAVTQLFTERYMVQFLFHNTVGAWRAAKVLARCGELREEAGTESDLRRATRLSAEGGYNFHYLRFVREPVEAEDGSTSEGPWRPASGSFTDWPRRAADLKVLDPCCGSGHFLVEGLHLFVRLRMEEEGLSVDEAVREVLSDNLYGLEIDPRCAQIAAFSLAFAAWKLAGRVIELPPLNIACSGIAPNGTKEEWLTLAERTATAMGSAPHRGVFGTRHTLTSDGLRKTFAALYDLFRQAPTLGSLIDPRSVGTGLFGTPFESLRPVLETVLEAKEAEPDRLERAVAAAGMVRAASLLAGTYSLVITNVPYLARGRQDATFRAFGGNNYPASKADLATMFVDRTFVWLGDHGAQAFVVPQSWLFLKTYQKLRENLLTRRRWGSVTRLGTGAFETIGGHVVNTALTVLSAEEPDSGCYVTGLDVSTASNQAPTPAVEKSRLLRHETSNAPIKQILQAQMRSGTHLIRFSVSPHPIRLGDLARSWQGLVTGDDSRYLIRHWETCTPGDRWKPIQRPPQQTAHWAGREMFVRWDGGAGDLQRSPGAHNFPPAAVRGRCGVGVQRMHGLAATLFDGEVFGDKVAPLLPTNDRDVAAIWTFARSPEFRPAVRQVNQKPAVTSGAFTEVGLDVARWRQLAAERYPNGLPEPYSDDPTQWIFHGHPCGSVVWDTENNRTVEGPLRTDPTVLQVAVARLLGYRWPADRDPAMRLADEARGYVERCEPLLRFGDEDGIVCLPALRGEAAAADRLRSLLAAAYGDTWSGATERELLNKAEAGAKRAASLDDWLRNHFFTAHCRLFHHRPFVWHIWDGLPDGFGSLVNYHRLAGPDGEGRRTLESLIYSYLGDWIGRQQDALRQETPGAEARLAAALNLKARLEAILAGAPPLDLFIRWKLLHEQPIGWEPDINDGLRLNIRPFLRAELRKGGKKGAGILRAKPNVKWTKDRGKEPQHLKPKRKGDDPEEYRPKADFPWFWSCPGEGAQPDRTDFPGGPAFDGARWNDLHYTTATKRAARDRAADAS